MVNDSCAMCVQQASRRKGSGAAAAVAIPSRPADTEYDKMSEVEVWLRLQRLLEVAKQKQGNLRNNFPASPQRAPDERTAVKHFTHFLSHQPSQVVLIAVT